MTLQERLQKQADFWDEIDLPRPSFFAQALPVAVLTSEQNDDATKVKPQSADASYTAPTGVDGDLF